MLHLPVDVTLLQAEPYGYGCLDQIINSALKCIGQSATYPRAHGQDGSRCACLSFHFRSLLYPLVIGSFVHHFLLSAEEISGGHKVVRIRSKHLN